MNAPTSIFYVSAALCLSMMAATLVPSETAGASAQVPATDLDYSVVEGEAVITGCGGHDCRDGLIIPSTVATGGGAIPVRHIAANAFEYPEDDDEDDGEP